MRTELQTACEMVATGMRMAEWVRGVEMYMREMSVYAG
jgi:hypothetical protein